MYAKCGSMEDAWKVFNKIPSWNVIWTAGWYLDMQNTSKNGRYFNKCNRKMCGQAILLLLECWLPVLASLHLKRASVFMNRSFKVVQVWCLCGEWLGWHVCKMWEHGGEEWRIWTCWFFHHNSNTLKKILQVKYGLVDKFHFHNYNDNTSFCYHHIMLEEDLLASIFLQVHWCQLSHIHPNHSYK